MIRLFRLYALLNRLHIPLLPRLLCLLNRILFGVVLPPTAKVGDRVEFAYHGLGIVVHARAVIGSDVYVGPHAIIGGRGGHYQVPVIEDGVEIGAGAMVLGPVRVGAGAKVGAGALVLDDVPPGRTVVGIPAKCIDPPNTRKVRDAEENRHGTTP